MSTAFKHARDWRWVETTEKVSPFELMMIEKGWLTGTLRQEIHRMLYMTMKDALVTSLEKRYGEEMAQCQQRIVAAIKNTYGALFSNPPPPPRYGRAIQYCSIVECLDQCKIDSLSGHLEVSYFRRSYYLLPEVHDLDSIQIPITPDRRIRDQDLKKMPVLMISADVDRICEIVNQINEECSHFGSTLHQVMQNITMISDVIRYFPWASQKVTEIRQNILLPKQSPQDLTDLAKYNEMMQR